MDIFKYIFIHRVELLFIIMKLIYFSLTSTNRKKWLLIQNIIFDFSAVKFWMNCKSCK